MFNVFSNTTKGLMTRIYVNFWTAQRGCVQAMQASTTEQRNTRHDRQLKMQKRFFMSSSTNI